MNDRLGDLDSPSWMSGGGDDAPAPAAAKGGKPSGGGKKPGAAASAPSEFGGGDDAPGWAGAAGTGDVDVEMGIEVEPDPKNAKKVAPPVSGTPRGGSQMSGEKTEADDEGPTVTTPKPRRTHASETRSSSAEASLFPTTRPWARERWLASAGVCAARLA